MKPASRDAIRRTVTMKRLALACALACLAGAGTAAAGPTIAFGKEGNLTFNYSLQAWGQARDFSSPTDDGKSTDFFLRRNRLTFSGQFNDLVGFYANGEISQDRLYGYTGVLTLFT